MQLHDVTILFVLTLASTVSAAVFAWGSGMLRNPAAPRRWAAAYALLALSSLSVLLFPDPDSPLRPLLFNAPMVFGYAFWLSGTLRFCQRPGHDRWVFAVAAAATLATVLLSLLWPLREWRVTLLGLGLLLLRGASAAALWQYGRHQQTTVARATALVLLLECATIVLRIADAWLGGALPVGTAGGGGLGNITWIGLLLTIIVCTPLLMLLGLGRLIEQLRKAAHHDQLTGLLNRRGFELALAPLLAREARQQPALAVLMIDIDHFKAINDRHGHATGDLALRAMGDALRASLRGGDLAMRCGGEEFCVWLSGSTAEQAALIAARVRDQFQQACAGIAALAGQATTASVGIALAADMRTGFEQLRQQADEALYQAKRAGRNRYAIAGELPA